MLDHHRLPDLLEGVASTQDQEVSHVWTILFAKQGGQYEQMTPVASTQSILELNSHAEGYLYLQASTGFPWAVGLQGSWFAMGGMGGFPWAIAGEGTKPLLADLIFINSVSLSLGFEGSVLGSGHPSGSL